MRCFHSPRPSFLPHQVSGEAKATGQSMGLLLATLFLNPNSRLGTRPLSEVYCNISCFHFQPLYHRL